MTYAATQPLHATDVASLHDARSGPLFTGLDVVGIIAAIVMALGPLTAYTVGF